MTYTSPTTVNGSLGLGNFLQYVNGVTNNWLSNMLLIGIYVIVLIGFYKAKEDFTGALAVAGYGTFVVALLFWLGNLISGLTFGIAIGVAILGTIILLMDKEG